MVDSQNKVQGSAYKALAVLLSFISEKNDLGVTEICRETGLDKTSVARALKALSQYALVQRDDFSRRYQLSYGVLQLAGSKIRQMPLTTVAQPQLLELAQLTGETVQLSVVFDKTIIYIGVIESAQPIRVASSVGARAPLHCTAAGKVLLANSQKSFVDEILSSPLIRCTSKTSTDRITLELELAQIRSSGWATDVEGFAEHVAVAAAPVRDNRGNVIAALAIGGPTARITKHRLNELAQMVVQFAHRISRNLGYIKPG